MIEGDHAWFFAEKLICEAIDVAEAEGLHFSYREVLNSVHATCEAVVDGFSSMSQDVMNCRITEVDAINGFVVERAAVHNVPAPYNTFVRNLIHAIEDTYKEQAMPLVKYAPDDVILAQGEVSTCIYRVMQGTVLLYTNRGQESEYFIGAYGEGKCFGEYSCLSGKPNLYSAISLGDSVVMQVPKKEIHHYISMNPKHAEEMLATMASQLPLLLKHIELLNEEVRMP